jgi:hypothetical protein
MIVRTRSIFAISSLTAIQAAGGAVALKGSDVAGEASFVEEARHVVQC